jgi:hypothetical protein
LGSIDKRFQELAQVSCRYNKQAQKHVIQHLYNSKELLLDIRHILVYQSFDQDIRNLMMNRADAIVSYINGFMNTLNKEQVQEGNLLCA